MDKKESYVYLTTNLINNKTYVGQRKLKNNNIENDDYFGSGSLISKAIAKYGKNNFKKDILIHGLFTKKELDHLEIFYISYYKFFNKAEYNISRGGNGGNLGEEVNKVLTLKNREKAKDPSFRKKISNSLRGTKPTKERNKKVSNAHISMKWINNGIIETQTKDNLPDGFVYGRLHKKVKKPLLTKEERRIICSNASKGAKNARSKKVFCLELNKSFDYIKEAVFYLISMNIISNKIATNGPTTQISNCCKCKTETAFGFHWKFE